MGADEDGEPPDVAIDSAPEPTAGRPADAAGAPPAGGPPPPRGGVRALMRRAGWNLLDQALSAGTNAALTVLVARSVSGKDFGAFAVAFIVFTLAIGAERALVGQPVSIRHSAATGREAAGVAARATGTVLAITVPAGLLCAAAGLFYDGTLRIALLAVGLTLPALILQDTCRMLFFARGAAHLAALNDAVWAVVQFGAISALILTDRASVLTLVLAWGGSAAVATVLGLVQLGALPRPAATRAWVRAHRDLVGYLFAQFMLGAGALQGGILIVGGLVGIGGLGALRAAQTFTGPLSVLFGAMFSFVLPELSRRSHLSATQRWRIAAVIGGGLFTVSAAFAGLLAFVPDELGTAVLGRTWPGTEQVLLPVALVSALAGACLGPAVSIFAMGRAKATFRLTVVEAFLVIGGLLIGAVLDGARGAAWGLCINQAILVPLWFWQLRHILGEDRRRPALARHAHT